jgi:hypothetical protein
MSATAGVSTGILKRGTELPVPLSLMGAKAGVGWAVGVAFAVGATDLDGSAVAEELGVGVEVASAVPPGLLPTEARAAITISAMTTRAMQPMRLFFFSAAASVVDWPH